MGNLSEEFNATTYFYKQYAYFLPKFLFATLLNMIILLLKSE